MVAISSILWGVGTDLGDLAMIGIAREKYGQSWCVLSANMERREVRTRKKDKGRPLGVDDQASTSNRPEPKRVIPENIALIELLPRSPGRNLAEEIWQDIPENGILNRVFGYYDDNDPYNHKVNCGLV